MNLCKWNNTVNEYLYLNKTQWKYFSDFYVFPNKNIFKTLHLTLIWRYSDITVYIIPCCIRICYDT